MTARSTRVLIAYGSRFGATKAIAYGLRTRFAPRVADVGVRALVDITDCDPYDAVVLGLRGADCCSRRSAAALVIIAIGPK